MLDRDHDTEIMDTIPAELFDSASGPQTGTVYLGIDLGTSRSAVATSNGVREVVGSVVGWPIDAVAARLVGKSVVFGDEALENRLSCDVIRPLADGNLSYPDLTGEERERSQHAAVKLLEEIVRLARVRKDQLVYAVIGAPAEATGINKQAILDRAREAGIDAAMVVSEPFSVAYAIDALDDAIVVDIGAGTIDICRLHGTLPEVEDQVTISKAGDFVDQQLADLIAKRHPEAQFTINMIKKAKERFSGVVDSDERAIVTFPVNGKPTELDVTDEMRQAVGLLVPEILEGVQRLVSSFDPEFQHRIRGRVYIGGGGSQIFGLRRALEEGMESIGGGNVFLVDEPVYAGANGGLKLAREMPASYWDSLRTAGE